MAYTKQETHISLAADLAGAFHIKNASTIELVFMQMLAASDLGEIGEIGLAEVKTKMRVANGMICACAILIKHDILSRETIEEEWSKNLCDSSIAHFLKELDEAIKTEIDL